MRHKLQRVDKKDLFVNAFLRFFPNAPIPTTEFKFHPERRWRFDVCWPSKQVAVEIEGGIWNPRTGHSSGRGITRDIEKGNAAVMLGWKLLRFSTQMVEKNPHDCCKQVAELLAA